MMKRTIGSIGLLALAACGGGSGTPNVSAAPNSCSGQQVVTVTNDWTGGVDIFGRVGGGEPRPLGTVPAGSRAEFPVPAGTTEVYPLQEGRDVANATSRNLRQFVNIRYQCR
jgi:hypothetical protein